MAARSGEAHHQARLTEVDVLAIRASSETNLTLAQRYGVSKPTIVKARLGGSWAHLPGAGERRTTDGAHPGEAHPGAKLTEKAVLSLRAGHATPDCLMERYGVTYMALWKARKGVTWKHLPLSPTDAQS